MKIVRRFLERRKIIHFTMKYFYHYFLSNEIIMSLSDRQLCVISNVDFVSEISRKILNNSIYRYLKFIQYLNYSVQRRDSDMSIQCSLS